MRVTKWVDFGQEVEINIDGAEALSAILGETEGWTPEELLKRAINNTGSLIKNMSPEVIAGFTPEVRAMIRKFLLEQAERFQ